MSRDPRLFFGVLGWIPSSLYAYASTLSVFFLARIPGRYNVDRKTQRRKQKGLILNSNSVSLHVTHVTDAAKLPVPGIDQTSRCIHRTAANNMAKADRDDALNNLV